ncbi:hypothetical protein C8R45DRAFT_199909 [Mycena sanguinolenta]|nr:hypothetical protein C8R45DRAFT_199909 [Mycena sanguinolenta]
MCSARNGLPLYLEILSEPKSGRPPDSTMVFLNHFYQYFARRVRFKFIHLFLRDGRARFGCFHSNALLFLRKLEVLQKLRIKCQFSRSSSRVEQTSPRSPIRFCDVCFASCTGSFTVSSHSEISKTHSLLQCCWLSLEQALGQCMLELSA